MRKQVTKRLRRFASVSGLRYRSLKRDWNRVPRPHRSIAHLESLISTHEKSL